MQSNKCMPETVLYIAHTLGLKPDLKLHDYIL